jgi:very-short-patch-repair endonuclease
VDRLSAERGRFGAHLAEDEGAEFLGREARGGAAVAVVLAGAAELPPEGRVLLAEPFAPALAGEPADLPAERLARPNREGTDFVDGEFDPHRDDGPSAPEGAVFRRPREQVFRAVGDGGHGKLRAVQPAAFFGQVYSNSVGGAVKGRWEVFSDRRIGNGWGGEMAADRRLIEFARQMRHVPTPAEDALWHLLRNRQLCGFKFRRQHPVGLYIADFYAPAAALVIELDGDTHATPEGVEHDRVRHAYLSSLDLAVIRFWNFEVRENPDGILERVGEISRERRGTRRRHTPRADRRVRSVPGES